MDVTTGDFLQQKPVLSLPGTVPLSLIRTYRSTENFSGLFGPKWADQWSRHLLLDGDATRFSDDDGVIYTFHTPETEEKVFSVNLHAGHYLLFGERSHGLHLFDRRSQLILSFGQKDGARRLLSAISDRHGNRITFHYDDTHGDSVQRLSQITHSDGYRLLLGYDQKNLAIIEYLTAELRQRLVTCHYDARGYLLECETFQFNHLWHQYNDQGYMIRWGDNNTTDVSVDYDLRGRVVSVTTPQGYWNDRFIYDDAERSTTYLDAEGGCSRYWYDDDGNLLRILDPLERETVMEWDLRNMVSETDPLGRTTYFEYSPYGELTKLIQPSGEAFTYDYDEYGQLLQAKLSDGKSWGFHYNEAGEPDSVTDPLGRIEEYRYNQHGELLRKILPDGTQWRYEYEQHRLHSMLSPNGYTTRYDQDGLGRLRCMTDALGQQTHYQHSAFHASLNGSVTEITQSDGVKQQITYDQARRITAVTDGEGQITQYTYGPFNLLTSMTRPDGTALHFDYDSLLRVNKVTTAMGETYQYEYDLAGQLVRETDFTDRTLEYAYDRGGRQTLIRYPNGQLTRFCYNDDDQIRRREHWQAGESACEQQAVIEYGYDPLGRLICAISPDAKVEFEYDEAGHLIGERVNGREITRQWDIQSGLPTAETVDQNTLNFGYNPSQQLTSFQFGQHDPLTLNYDSLGRETVRESAKGFILASRYTTNGQLAHQSAGRATSLFRETLQQNHPYFPPQATAVNRSWQYDRAFNIQVIDDSIWGQTRYRYNQNDQVTHAAFEGFRSFEEQFHYDKQGNLSRHLPNDARNALKQADQLQLAGRVVHRGDATYRYDQNGRLVEKTEHRDGFRPQIWRYRWDIQDQLTHCETPDGSRWQYKYDAFGRRIQKLKVHDGKLVAANLQRWLNGKPDLTLRQDAIIGHDFLWSGDQLIEEIPIYADGTLAYDHSIRWLYAPGTLTPWARYERGKLHYTVSDHQGTVRELLNEEGQLIWAGRLSTWGRLDTWPAVAGDHEDAHVGCHLRFMGQYADEETGLYYNRFRYYDHETGQYLTPDPLNLHGGFNPYGYVHNPVRFVDPFGLSPDSTTFYHAGHFEDGTKIDLSKGTGKKDFDPGGKKGFYVTASKEQALEWAKKKNYPTLATFEIPNSELAKLNIKVLDTSTDAGKEEWMRFVREGRKNKLVHNHDGVSGPMLMNPPDFKRGRAPDISGHQLALYTKKATDMFDKHKVSVKQIADVCP
ncbi:RHS repeat-associated core domain-containing protein [Xenorhabdus littoralis]|uniref:RHS repeat-associated core domain-containing protein n=1 Tax=Xenorhabdus littoralis TaxID=2582835 RepID=UPI0029E7EFB2|nr:RHS repeat-associated core domain-containing protein [Xenorhabdus sp. Reich]